jgi:hypothetical protein
MSRRPQCIAYRETDGQRCRRLVGRRPWPARWCLCQQHARSLLLVAMADQVPYVARLRRAGWSWRNASELFARLRRER